MVPVFAAWLLAIASSRFIPPRYRSETVILVEQQKIAEQYVGANIAIDLQERLQSMSEQILSRTRLQGIIENFHLNAAGGASSDLDAPVQRMRRDIKIDLVPGRLGQLSAFTISYAAPTAQLAQQVTNELSSLFIAENLRNRQELSEDTTNFLEGQLAESRAKLDREDERLREFKANNLGQLPEQLQSNLQILSGLQTRLQAATAAMDQANQQSVYLESVLAQYKTLRAQVSRQDTTLSSPQALEEQVERLKAELADLSAYCTADHPDVIRIKEQLATLNKLLEQANTPSALNKTAVKTDTIGSPRDLAELRAMSPMMGVAGQIKANQLEVQNRQRQVKELEEEIRQYQSRLNIVPMREQELAAITRDHEQARVNYESLLTKKQQSEMATNLEKRQQREQFRIIDPPNLPHKPYWPDRFKLGLIGLALGSILACGLLALVEMIDARIYRPGDLRDLTGLPVLTAIPPLRSPAEREARQWRKHCETVTASAMVAFISLVTLFTYFKG